MNRPSFERLVSRDNFFSTRVIRIACCALALVGFALLVELAWDLRGRKYDHLGPMWAQLTVGMIFFGVGLFGLQKGDAKAAFKDGAEVFGTVTSGLSNLKPWGRIVAKPGDQVKVGERASDPVITVERTPSLDDTEPADPARQDMDLLDTPPDHSGRM